MNENGMLSTTANPAGPGSLVEGRPPDAPPQVKKTRWVAIPEYEGWAIRMWTNFPTRVFVDMGEAKTSEDMAAILGKVLLEHNNWKDDEGMPYPPPSEAGFYEQLPPELLAILMVVVKEEAVRLPNSLLATRGA